MSSSTSFLSLTTLTLNASPVSPNLYPSQYLDLSMSVFLGVCPSQCLPLSNLNIFPSQSLSLSMSSIGCTCFYLFVCFLQDYPTLIYEFQLSVTFVDPPGGPFLDAIPLRYPISALIYPHSARVYPAPPVAVRTPLLYVSIFASCVSSHLSLPSVVFILYCRS